jgi:hypothetical protein
VGYALYVKSDSNGMVSSMTTSVGGFRHLFELGDMKHIMNLR